MSRQQGSTREIGRRQAQRILGRACLLGVFVSGAAGCGSEESQPAPLTLGGTSEPRAEVVRVETPPTTPAVSVPTTPTAKPVSAALSNVTYGDAERVFRSGDYNAAAEMFDAYVQRMPTNPWGHYMLGLSAWRAGDHTGAVGALKSTLEVDPKHQKALINLARVLLEQRKASDALDYALKVVELDSTSSEGWRVLGNAHAELRMHDAAADSYKKAIALDPQDAQTMNNLGLLRIQQGEYVAALSPLARATELKPKVAVFQNNLGVALERSGYLHHAADAYRAALAADAGNARAKTSLERVEPRTRNAEVSTIDLDALATDFVKEIDGWRSAGQEWDRDW